MTTPRSAPLLREFELMVLLAVVQLGDTAYPLAIGDAIEKKTGRKASRAAVLITLDRLEDKGLLTSAFGEPTPVRGGRAKRLFLPKPTALVAVEQALDRIDAMRHGLDEALDRARHRAKKAGGRA